MGNYKGITNQFTPSVPNSIFFAATDKNSSSKACHLAFRDPGPTWSSNLETDYPESPELHQLKVGAKLVLTWGKKGRERIFVLNLLCYRRTTGAG